MTLLEQFNTMQALPIFEIEVMVGDFQDYIIEADKHGLSILYTDVIHEWDNDLSLDENLNILYDILIDALGAQNHVI